MNTNLVLHTFIVAVWVVILMAAYADWKPLLKETKEPWWVLCLAFCIKPGIFIAAWGIVSYILW